MNCKTRKEKQEQINNIARYIAYQIFGSKDNAKFVSAYDRIKSRTYLDYNFNINDRLKSPKNKDKTMFEVLSDDELDLVLESSIKLLNMYNEVIKRRTA